MKAYKITTCNKDNRHREWIQLSEDKESAELEAKRHFECGCPSDGEHISDVKEVIPESSFWSEVLNFAALFQHDSHAQYLAEYPDHADDVHWHAWHVFINPGRKYINVDIGGCGKYMITPDGEIYGIKGYGVIHKGHFYGTLATIGEYWWGKYTANKGRKSALPPPSFSFSGSTPPEPTEEEHFPAIRGRVAISTEVATILNTANVSGNELTINQRVERPTYIEVNKVLEALGGKWNRAKGCHVFEKPVLQVLDAALNRGFAIDHKKANNQFFTPPPIAARMVELAGISADHRVLEPSAGSGNIIKAIGDKPYKVAVEIDSVLVESLMRCGVSGLRIHEGDFLNCNGNLGEFDRVVMNPPFQNGADIIHIRHALTMLKSGGRLVALCANGPRQHEALEPITSTWEALPNNSFKEEGTSVSVAMIIINK